MSEFDERFKAKKKERPPGKELIRASVEFSALRKAIESSIKSEKVTDALSACPKANDWLLKFEDLKPPSDEEKAKTVDDAASYLSFISDDDLKRQSTEDRAQSVFDLCTQGVPEKGTGMVDPRQELIRLYLASKPDPAFVNKRRDEGILIGRNVAAVPELGSLIDRSGGVKQRDWTAIAKDRKALERLLQKVCDAQTKTLDMPSIPVQVFEDTSNTANIGGYNWDVGAIKINAGATNITNFKEAVVTILHETFHGNQHFLVKQLEAGEIKPGHALYPTALMFLANSHSVGYLSEKLVGRDTYFKQPQELDAEQQGLATYDMVIAEVLAVPGS